MFTPDTPNFQSLMLMLDAAHMGWWKADFQAGELHVSEYIAKLLGLDGDKVRIGQLTHLVREDYRMPIHNEFMALKANSTGRSRSNFPRAKSGSTPSSSDGRPTPQRVRTFSATCSASPCTTGAKQKS